MFYVEFITIEEAKNITTMKVDELIGSLLTLEMAIDDKSKKKSKGVTFRVNNAKHDD